MEVSVSDSTGLPDGYLISIRAGGTRRQAPVPLSEPLRFPCLPADCQHLKVDVLKTLGSGRLDVAGKAELESYRCAITMADGGEAKLDVTVREDPSLCGLRAAELKQLDRSLRRTASFETTRTAAEPGSPCSPTGASNTSRDERARVVREVRDYAREHNLPHLVQEMLQSVLKERPADPISMMAACLRCEARRQGEPTPTETVPATTASPSGIDVDRLQLEAEHLTLHAERARLLRELSQLSCTNPC